MKPRRHTTNGSRQERAQPRLHQRAPETQVFESILPDVPLGLSFEARGQCVHLLNQVLVDTITLRDLYKKSHWQVSGPTFYQLHLLFDKHYEEQAKLVDEVAERIQTLGGLAAGMPDQVAEMTAIERPPRGREEVPVQISRLLEAHQVIMQNVRAAARRASEVGDDGTNDLLVSSVLRTNETQAWFLYEHVVKMDLVVAR
ncbi:MAG TPA: DNA starvation/stationary phase protection protein [Verrucomicrobiae bacterium]|jgi:starvation-inducible DNA-binding protein